VLAVLMLRVSIRPPDAPWIVAIGTPVFLMTPSETPKVVTGRVCRNIVAFCVEGSQIESTSVSTKRFVGTKTYCDWLTTTALPE
jgi:hypothetical protein